MQWVRENQLKTFYYIEINLAVFSGNSQNKRVQYPRVYIPTGYTV